MKYKLLVLDVDGTLVESREKGELNQVVIDSIRSAAIEIKISLCTGRTQEHIRKIIETLGIDNSYHVIESGTKLLNPLGQLEYEKNLTRSDLHLILSTINNSVTSYGICESGTWKSSINDLNNGNVTVISLHSDSQQNTKEIIGRLKMIKGKYAYHVGSSWYSKEGAFISVTHKQADKRFGLEYIQKKLGIKKEETIGVGDMPNDLPLFEVSGLKIAMGNAHSSLKKKADIIAPPLKNNGVAWIVDKYILNKSN